MKDGLASGNDDDDGVSKVKLNELAVHEPNFLFLPIYYFPSRQSFEPSTVKEGWLFGSFHYLFTFFWLRWLMVIVASN